MSVSGDGELAPHGELSAKEVEAPVPDSDSNAFEDHSVEGIHRGGIRCFSRCEHAGESTGLAAAPEPVQACRENRDDAAHVSSEYTRPCGSERSLCPTHQRSSASIVFTTLTQN